MRRWLVRAVTQDGERTSYVYGPITRDGAVEFVGWRSNYRVEVIDAREISDGDYREAEPVRRRPWWERGAAPTHYFFSKHLGREPIRDSASPYAIRARRQEAGREGTGPTVADEIAINDDGHSGADGDAT